jgi:hypothetical protein
MERHSQNRRPKKIGKIIQYYLPIESAPFLVSSTLLLSVDYLHEWVLVLCKLARCEDKESLEGGDLANEGGRTCQDVRK